MTQLLRIVIKLVNAKRMVALRIAMAMVLAMKKTRLDRLNVFVKEALRMMV